MGARPGQKRSKARRLRLIKELASGKHATATDAALAVGYPPKTAAANASAVVKEIRETFPAALARLGFNPETIILEILVPALKAMQKKFAQSKGEFTDERTVEDWETRLRATDMLMKASGAYDNDKAGDGEPAKLIINISNMADGPKHSDDPIPVQGKVITDTPVHPPFTSPKKEDPSISSHSPNPDDGTDCC